MTTNSTPGYALGYLREVEMCQEIVDYLRCIDATLTPFGGRFLVHGGQLTGLEGEWDGDLIVIEFPDADAARRWYASEAYQQILPLRTAHSEGIVAVVEGVGAGYVAADKVAELGAA